MLDFTRDNSSPYNRTMVTAHFQADPEPKLNSESSYSFGAIKVVEVHYSVLKRSFDFFVALFGLVALMPFLLAIAMLIKADSKGPALFRQKRNGLGGTTFTIFKFRTMSVMEDGDVAQQAKTGDLRISPFGAILRKLSIDELPQLYNVLRGDMSLVGPRPHPTSLDATFAPLIPNYMDRYAVKPGLTGLAQVEGARGETSTLDSMLTRTQFDQDYIAKASFVFDIWIVLRTILLLFSKPTGA
ncbi:MAG: putative glycosyltransferase [Pseudomonadota bacterium]|jgi:lipopolysaccharide/colanic/teichoic acid biosynthesis glycosyltransferase